VKDTNGNPLSGVEVSWSTGAKTTTNAQGQTSITVNVTASGTITATVQGASGSITVTCVQAGVGGVISLPRTDTVAPGTPSLMAWLALVAALALIVPAAIRYRRRSS
jgi:hypothetical protein